LIELVLFDARLHFPPCEYAGAETSEHHFRIANQCDVSFLTASDANEQPLVKIAGVVESAAKPRTPNLPVRRPGAFHEHVWPAADVAHDVTDGECGHRT
jgi:hypothetical protein